MRLRFAAYRHFSSIFLGSTPPSHAAGRITPIAWIQHTPGPPHEIRPGLRSRAGGACGTGSGAHLPAVSPLVDDESRPRYLTLTAVTTLVRMGWTPTAPNRWATGLGGASRSRWPKPRPIFACLTYIAAPDSCRSWIWCARCTAAAAQDRGDRPRLEREHGVVLALVRSGRSECNLTSRSRLDQLRAPAVVRVRVAVSAGGLSRPKPGRAALFSRGALDADRADSDSAYVAPVCADDSVPLGQSNGAVSIFGESGHRRQGAVRNFARSTRQAADAPAICLHRVNMRAITKNLMRLGIFRLIPPRRRLPGAMLADLGSLLSVAERLALCPWTNMFVRARCRHAADKACCRRILVS